MPLDSRPQIKETVTIATSAAVSGISGDFHALTLVGLDVSDWTAGKMTFKTSPAASGDLKALIDGTSAVTIASFSGAVQIALDPAKFVSVRRIQIVSENNQAAARTIGLILREVQ